MARIKAATGITLPGRAFGVSFATQNGNAVARARVIPVNPKNNATAVAANALAYVAALWRLFGPAIWTNWYTPPQTLADGYNLFMQWNIRAYTWGCDYFEAPLKAPVLLADPIFSLVSAADGIHSIIQVGTGGGSAPPGGLYMRIYFAWTTVPGNNQPDSSSYAYAFSIGPLAMDAYSNYDVTDIVNANLGQWINPGDPANPPYTLAALTLNTGYYCTDNTGLVFETGGGPFYNIFGGPIPESYCPAPLTPLLPLAHVAPWLRWNQRG